MFRTGILVTAFCFLFAGFAAAADTIREREQKEAYQKQMELRLAEVNQKLSTVTSRASDVKEDSRSEFNRQLEELQKRRELASRKLAELRAASGQDWERLKAETYAAIGDLDRMYDRMKPLLKGI